MTKREGGPSASPQGDKKRAFLRFAQGQGDKKGLF